VPWALSGSTPRRTGLPGQQRAAGAQPGEFGRGQRWLGGGWLRPPEQRGRRPPVVRQPCEGAGGALPPRTAPPQRSAGRRPSEPAGRRTAGARGRRDGAAGRRLPGSGCPGGWRAPGRRGGVRDRLLAPSGPTGRRAGGVEGVAQRACAAGGDRHAVAVGGEVPTPITGAPCGVNRLAGSARAANSPATGWRTPRAKPTNSRPSVGGSPPRVPDSVSGSPRPGFLREAAVGERAEPMRTVTRGWTRTDPLPALWKPRPDRSARVCVR
jgi:hypothetical protein